MIDILTRATTHAAPPRASASKRPATTVRPVTPATPMTKNTVIIIAIVVAILLVVCICIGIFFFVRRRKKEVKAKTHDKPYMRDRNIDSTLDSVGKIPLIQQDNISSVTEYRNAPDSKYDEENDVDITSQSIHRSPSGGSMRSMPPAYSAMTHRASPDTGDIMNRTFSRSSHRHGSSAGGSDGLRPLMLVQGRQDPDSDPEDVNERGRERRAVRPDSSLSITGPVGRPRASSRFREEDLDL